MTYAGMDGVDGGRVGDRTGRLDRHIREFLAVLGAWRRFGAGGSRRYEPAALKKATRFTRAGA
jgi:hypothetical protein